MKRLSVALFVVALLIVAVLPVVAFAAEVVEDGFDPNSLILGGVALAPIISIIISVIKGWSKIDSKYVPLINVLLGAVAVAIVGIVNNGLPVPAAIAMTLGVVFGSQVFHETFGHALKAVGDLLGKKPGTTSPDG